MYHLVILINILSAGIIHLIVAPEHFNHAPAHGIFFAATGFAQIMWAITFWRKPTERSYIFGLLMTGGLVIAWLITRWLPTPFEGFPGPIEFWGLYVVLAEMVAIGALIALSQEEDIVRFSTKPTLRRSIFTAIILAILGGSFLYYGGLALEPLLPSLMGEVHPDVEAEDHEH